MTGKRLKVMVSSTVYGNEELFELVYTILTQPGNMKSGCHIKALCLCFLLNHV